jgi:hypothetical protein
MPEHHRWSIGDKIACWAAVSAVLANLISLFIFYVEIRMHWKEREIDITPRLEYVEGSGSHMWDPDGIKNIAFKNECRESSATVTGMRYEITDPVFLDLIDRRWARTSPPIPVGISDIKSADKIVFRECGWRGKRCFVFSAKVYETIPPGGSKSFHLCIGNPNPKSNTWDGSWFFGRLITEYDGREYIVDNVTLAGPKINTIPDMPPHW